MAYRACQVIVIYVLLSAASTALAYVMSVASGHVSPFLPCLGYIGDQPLESTLFTQCFVVDSALLMLLVQIRYVYASFHLQGSSASHRILAANDAGISLGYASALGLFVVACFQESNAYYAHHLGILFFFLGSIVYFALQSVVSKALISSRRDELVLRTRIVLNCLTFFFFLLFAVGHLMSLSQFDKPWEHRHHWRKGDGGWVPHVVGAFAQWILFLLFQMYFFTFYTEFKSVMLTKTRMIVLTEEEQVGSATARI